LFETAEQPGEASDARSGGGRTVLARLVEERCRCVAPEEVFLSHGGAHRKKHRTEPTQCSMNNI
jgi:hypothetical protein